MVKDVFVWTDTPESMDSAKPLELQPTTPSQTLPSAVQAIQFWQMVNVFAQLDLLK